MQNQRNRQEHRESRRRSRRFLTFLPGLALAGSFACENRLGEHPGTADEPNRVLSPGESLEPGADGVSGAADAPVGGGLSGAVEPSPTEGPAEPSALVSNPLGPTAGRRLTKQEFLNTVTDLLGAEAGAEAERIEGESASQLRFRNDLREVTVSDQRVANYELIATDIATAVSAEALASFAPCTDATEDCRTGFVEELGLQLYRRPLQSDEVENLARLFSATPETEASFARGSNLVLRAMLQSPHFLYKLERDQTAPSGYEIASRVAFMLWKAGPDRPLLSAVATGGFDGLEAVTARAAEMLNDPRALRGVREFADDWLRVYRNLDRSTNVDVGLTEAALSGMREETLRFVERVLMDENAPLMNLFSDQQTEISADLAPLYDLEANAEGRYDLTARSERVGLLTQLAVLGSRAGPQRASIVDRGLAIGEDFLCIQVPPPPPAAQQLAATFEEQVGNTAPEREKLAVHTQNESSCSVCHSLIDPFGLPFENYDVSGRYADTDEHGNRLFGDGELTLDGQTQAYANVAEFSAIIAQSPTVHRCLVEKFIQYGLGRRLTTDDDPLLESVFEQLEQTDGSYADLIAAMASNGAFDLPAPEVASAQ